MGSKKTSWTSYFPPPRKEKTPKNLVIFYFILYKILLPLVDASAVFMDTYNATAIARGWLLNCSGITLDVKHFEQFTNRSVFIKELDLLLDDSSYFLGNNSITFCEPEKEVVDKQSESTLCLAKVYLTIVVWSLFTQTAVNNFVEDIYLFWTCSTGVTGCGMLSIIVILLILGLDEVSDAHFLMNSIPAFTHVYLLCSFTWQSCFNFFTYIIVSHFPSERTAHNFLRIKVNVSYEWLKYYAIAILFCVASLGSMINFPMDKDPSFQDNHFCWLITPKPILLHFILLVVLLLALNFAIYYLFNTFKKRCSYISRRHVELISKQLEQLQQNNTFSCKRFLFLCMIWFIGALGSVPSLRWLYYVFVIAEIAIAILFMLKILICLKYSVPVNKYKMLFAHNPWTIIRSDTNCNENPLLDIIKD